MRLKNTRLTRKILCISVITYLFLVSLSLVFLSVSKAGFEDIKTSEILTIDSVKKPDKPNDDPPGGGGGDGGGGGSCFLLGTKIAMPDGTYKNIEQIKIGDIVKAYNAKTKEITQEEVLQIFHHKREQMTPYYLIINEDLKVTPNHPIYKDGKYIEAGKLKAGDKINIENNQITINSIEKIYTKEPTYNFEVKTHHNYFVKINEEELLVHNKPSGGDDDDDEDDDDNTFDIFDDSQDNGYSGNNEEVGDGKGDEITDDDGKGDDDDDSGTGDDDDDDDTGDDDNYDGGDPIGNGGDDDDDVGNANNQNNKGKGKNSGKKESQDTLQETYSKNDVDDNKLMTLQNDIFSYSTMDNTNSAEFELPSIIGNVLTTFDEATISWKVLIGFIIFSISSLVIILFKTKCIYFISRL